MVRLEKSCLSDTVKKELMDMFYGHQNAFSLRYEIGAYLKIQVEIEVTDNLHILSDHIVWRKKISLFLERNEKGYAI